MQADHSAARPEMTSRVLSGSLVMEGDHSPSRTSLLRRLVVLAHRWVGPILIALVLFEVLIRTFVYSPRPEVPDPLMGQIPAPGSTWVNGREGLGRIHWNQQGIRGRDLPQSPAGSVHRVVVIGDSYCAAEGVDDNQTFCAMLEADLARRLGREVWIGNCGRSNLEAADYMYFLPAYERKFHPELILIAFNLSDFRIVDHHLLPGLVAHFDTTLPSSQRLLSLESSEPQGSPHGDAGVSGRLSGLGHALLDHSGLMIYGASRLYAKVRKPRPEMNIRRDDQIASVQQMEQYFAALAALSKTPVVCTYIRPWNLVLPADNHFDEVTACRMQQAASRVGIPFLDTGTAFRQQVLATRQPGNGFPNAFDGPGIGHLNPAGHAVVARALAPLMTRLLRDGSGRMKLRMAQSWARAAGVKAPVHTCLSIHGPAAGERRLASGFSRS